MKGITPVIATVLLLMITIALVGFAFTWFQGMWVSVSETTGTQIKAQQLSMMKTMTIDNVECTTGKIYIRNTGSVDIASSEISIYVGSALSNCGTGITPPTLTPGALGICNHGSAISGTTVKATGPGSISVYGC
ncbi:MAG: hypothetical protein HZB66_01420 [Candidatus Aenigmarchaeota archaeon]|nr:hypothetical protein [Candidatus Aenigmarchaeota archaeon]